MNHKAKFRRDREWRCFSQRLWAVLLFAVALLLGLKAQTETCDSLFSEARTTLDFYNANAANYRQTRSHVSPELQKQRLRFEALLKINGALKRTSDQVSVLEVGSGHGRDAKYFAERGIHIVATEPSAALAKIAEMHTGRSVLQVRAQDIRGFQNHFDGVWAAASLIHVPTAELPMIFKNLTAGLKVGGVIHASFIKGVGTPDIPETLSDGRYFNRVSEATLRRIVGEIPGLRVIEKLTGSESDDYFGAAAPTSTFGFFNLYLVREF